MQSTDNERMMISLSLNLTKAQALPFAGLLQPVLKWFSSHCILDSFTFAKTMQNLDIDPNVFMRSLDVSSFFTNVPFDETIKIWSEALYDDSCL